MSDLLGAYKQENRKPYYLQFLTLKMKDSEWELIDGQQRLTTLTILFSVFSRLPEIGPEAEFTRDKLNYQVRQNFVQEYVCNNVQALLDADGWRSFIERHPEHDNQDVFFLFEAARAIHRFIENKVDAARRKDFYTFICDHVHLVVNRIEGDMKSEKVFINVNKGVRLLDEDLVKALIITMIPRDRQQGAYRMTDTEMSEIRTNIGRQWDEISRWAGRDDIRAFFRQRVGSSQLGWLIGLTFSVPASAEETPLFDHIDILYRQKSRPAVELFSEIRKTMLTLNDWYLDAEMHNLLGYTLHATKSERLEIVWKELKACGTRAEMIKKLKTYSRKALPLEPDGTLQELSYPGEREKLFSLFVMLDVAKVLPIGGKRSAAYDFGKIEGEDWSIEHVFPQNPRDLGKPDLDLLKEVLPGDFNELAIEEEEKKRCRKLFKKIQASDERCTLNEEEQEALEHILARNAGPLHRPGNLALLDKSLNSVLSNHAFDKKRNIVVEKVSGGRFVPYHTYDVFSKLVIDGHTSLHAWTLSDIVAHEVCINKRVGEIVTYLNN